VERRKREEAILFCWWRRGGFFLGERQVFSRPLRRAKEPLVDIWL
jgi:hypothetical protein